jgi:cysteine desulfurase / selenocysteine lyase
MNTSDSRLQLDEGAISNAKAAVSTALPDVAALTQMANAFFRALPGQEVAPVPGAVEITDSHLPQFGYPAPSVPSPASVDRLPIATEVTRPPITELQPHLPADKSALPGQSALSPYSSPLSYAHSLPLQVDPPQASAVQAHASPFSVPLPDFDLAFPHFEASLPVIPPLPALANDEVAKSMLQEAAHFYFIEHAGVLSQPMAPTDGSRSPKAYEPALVPDLGPIRRRFEVTSIRRDFPILNEKVNGKPLIWLDNAATTQKPQAVIDRISYFYEHENSNIHRAAHELAARATDAYEDARQKVKHFLNASSEKEIVFVRGATEAINLVAKSWGQRHIGKDDEIIVSTIEHHAPRRVRSCE